MRSALGFFVLLTIAMVVAQRDPDTGHAVRAAGLDRSWEAPSFTMNPSELAPVAGSSLRKRASRTYRKRCGRDRPLPPDPVAVGECGLFVELVSLETGLPIDSPIRLFRCDAPGNDDWLAGDQVQVEWTVPKQGVWFRGLPAGTYRARVAEQTHATADPPAFALAGSETRIRFVVPTPRESRSRLIVLDERGRRLDAVGSLRAGYPSRIRTTVPSWLRVRGSRHPERHAVGSIPVGRLGAATMNWRTIRGRDGEFEIAAERESPRHEERSDDTEFRIRGRTCIRIPDNHQPRSATDAWLAVSLPEDLVRQAIRLPDGSVASEAETFACADAVLVPYPEPSGFWRHLTVHVQVRLAGYDDLEFDVIPMNRPEIRVLQPKSQAADG